MRKPLVETNEPSRRTFVKSIFGLLIPISLGSVLVNAQERRSRHRRHGVRPQLLSHVPPIIIGKGSLLVYTDNFGLNLNTVGTANPNRPFRYVKSQNSMTCVVVRINDKCDHPPFEFPDGYGVVEFYPAGETSNDSDKAILVANGKSSTSKLDSKKSLDLTSGTFKPKQYKYADSKVEVGRVRINHVLHGGGTNNLADITFAPDDDWQVAINTLKGACEDSPGHHDPCEFDLKNARLWKTTYKRSTRNR